MKVLNGFIRIWERQCHNYQSGIEDRSMTILKDIIRDSDFL